MKESITRLYIKQLESLGDGKINWDKWELLIEKTKKEIYEKSRDNR